MKNIMIILKMIMIIIVIIVIEKITIDYKL